MSVLDDLSIDDWDMFDERDEPQGDLPVTDYPIAKPEVNPYAPADFQGAWELSNRIAKMGLCPDALRGKPHDIFFVLAYGHDFGMSFSHALRQVHIVKGKPSLSADAMMGIVRGSGLCEFFRCTESTNKSCTYITKRVDEVEATAYVYTIEDAQQAGLTGSNTWRSHPKAMLRARCKSALARMVYEDVVGNVYTPDELREARQRRPQPAPGTVKNLRSAMQDVVNRQPAAEPIAQEYEARRPKPIETIEVEAEEEGLLGLKGLGPSTVAKLAKLGVGDKQSLMHYLTTTMASGAVPWLTHKLRIQLLEQLDAQVGLGRFLENLPPDKRLGQAAQWIERRGGAENFSDALKQINSSPMPSTEDAEAFAAAVVALLEKP
jgi:hypothetical protein